MGSKPLELGKIVRRFHPPQFSRNAQERQLRFLSNSIARNNLVNASCGAGAKIQCRRMCHRDRCRGEYYAGWRGSFAGFCWEHTSYGDSKKLSPVNRQLRLGWILLCHVTLLFDAPRRGGNPRWFAVFDDHIPGKGNHRALRSVGEEPTVLVLMHWVICQI